MPRQWSAALAAAARTTDAEDTAAPAAGSGGTVDTGDVIQGKKVVSALDVHDLEAGKKHLLSFQGVQAPTGHHWYVSEWPGNENAATAASRHAGIVFNRLLRPNSDLAIDFHTGPTGLDCGAFNIGDRTISEVKTMMPTG